MYNVKATRADIGSYTLSYGKGAKKITARLDKTADGWTTGGAFVVVGPSKRETVEAWGKWAEKSYAGGGPLLPEEQTDTDDLSQWQRDFFATMSQKRGKLTDWQRSQLRSVIRELSGDQNDVPNGEKRGVPLVLQPKNESGNAASAPPPRYAPAKVQGPPPQAGVPHAGPQVNAA